MRSGVNERRDPTGAAMTQAQTTQARTMRAERLERTMARVRAFGIALGIYLTYWYVPSPGKTVPPSMRVIAGAGLALLATENFVVLLTLRRKPGAAALERLGMIVFLADMAAVWTIVWAFNFEEFGATWTIITVLCLEGAIRYQLRGAMLPVLVALPIETARELFRHSAFGFNLYASSVAFRIGLFAMIAAVAGAMARSLEQERAHAEARARENEELARRETDARRESNAFQQVILAGVSAVEPVEALQRMLEHIARDLGYSRLIVLLTGEDGRLHPLAAYGFASHVFDRSAGAGEGIAGAVVQSGTAEIVDDVRRDPRYLSIDESTRSQVTVPIRRGDDIIGAIDVESQDLNAFTEADASRLERLGAQMALVLEKTRLLSQERATVERLRELDLMKSDFIAIASHELRTPLTSMQGSIKTLRRSDIKLTSEEALQLLAVLDRQSDRLTRLVEDLLLVSRIDAGGVSLRFESVDIGEVCNDLLRELGRRGERVSVALPPDLPHILTDGQRVYQVARNLVENALKFSSEDSIVRVTVHGDGDRLLLEVEDSGPGIPEAELPSIFDRFHQIGGALRRRAEGFGLGLYITKRLVEALRGEIEVSSVVGKGTTFRVRIPFQRAETIATETA